MINHRVNAIMTVLKCLLIIKRYQLTAWSICNYLIKVKCHDVFMPYENSHQGSDTHTHQQRQKMPRTTKLTLSFPKLPQLWNRTRQDQTLISRTVDKQAIRFFFFLGWVLCFFNIKMTCYYL